MRGRFARRGFTAIDTAVSAGRKASRRVLGAKGNGERFADFLDRTWSTDLAISRQALKRQQTAKWADLRWGDDWAGNQTPLIHWRGVPNIKDPYDLSLVPLLLSELRPATILEIGAYMGGSTIWMADLLEAIGVDYQIVSFDIDIDRIPAEAKNDRIQYVKADCMHPDTLDGPWLELPHPWLVIEDAHVNTGAVLDHFHPHIKSGDYVIVEDTGFLVDKYRQFAAFMTSHHTEYKVDTRFTDLFGYNGTMSFNGYVKRM
jgi:cephalosporin hydroxylase